MEDLIDALTEVAERTDVRAVILATAGHVFSSGHDLTEIRGADHETQQTTFDACARLMQLIQTIPQPVIAQVQGVATAAGCQLVATCDLAVAAESARFATPGVKIGLFCSTPMVALSRAVPAKQAMRMLLTGDFVSAEDALKYGLVSDVVADADLESATLELARKVASASSATVAVGKAAFYEQRELPVADAYARMSQVMADNAVAADAQEGIDAFLTKRPQWRTAAEAVGVKREGDRRVGDSDRSQRLHRGAITGARRSGQAVYALCRRIQRSPGELQHWDIAESALPR